MARTLASQLEESFHRFRRDLADLHLLLASLSTHPSWLDRLRKQVHQFHEHLEEHFSLQEENGYLDQVEVCAPHYHERLVSLHNEQLELVRQLEDLEEALADAGPAALPALTRRLGELMDKIVNHEQRKNLLTLNAFNVEPGAMD
jgi:hypothetical protein